MEQYGRAGRPDRPPDVPAPGLHHRGIPVHPWNNRRTISRHHLFNQRSTASALCERELTPISVSIVALLGTENRQEDDLQIPQQVPVLDVLQVVLDPLLHLDDVVGL